MKRPQCCSTKMLALSMWTMGLEWQKALCSDPVRLQAAKDTEISFNPENLIMGIEVINEVW